MKVAITAEEGSINAYVDSRLGRAAYYLIGELGTPINSWQVCANAVQASGAGVAAAQFLVKANVEAVVAGNVGPKASQVFNAAGICVYLAGRVSVAQAAAALEKGELTQVKDPSVLEHAGLTSAGSQVDQADQAAKILLAVATNGDMVAQHFGHCPIYTLVSLQNGAEVGRQVVKNPGHTPGFLPGFLAEKGVNCVVAGGIGQRAIDLFHEQGVDTIVGVSGPIDEVVALYASGHLQTGQNVCDH